MIDTKEALFKAAPRKSGVVNVEGEDLAVYEMTVRDRFAFTDFAKEHSGDDDLCYAFLLSRCCPVLKDAEPSEILENLSPAILTAGGLKVMELSGAFDEKKPSAPSDDSSTDSP